MKHTNEQKAVDCLTTARTLVHRAATLIYQPIVIGRIADTLDEAISTITEETKANVKTAANKKIPADI